MNVIKPMFLTLLTFFIPSLAIADERVWEHWKSENGIDVFYRNHLDGLVEVKAQMKVNTRISAFIALLDDTENASLWLDRVESVAVLDQIAMNENIVYSKFSAPWPAKNRDMVTYSRYEQKPDGSLVLEISDLSSYLPPQNNYLRISNVFASWSLKPLKNSEVLITYHAFADPGGALPHWLINQLALTSVYKTFENLSARLVLQQYQDAQYPNIKEAKF